MVWSRKCTAITAERGTAIGEGGTGIAALVTTATVTGLTTMASVRRLSLFHSAFLTGTGITVLGGTTGTGINSTVYNPV
jgi:hypothetical protein